MARAETASQEPSSECWRTLKLWRAEKSAGSKHEGGDIEACYLLALTANLCPMYYPFSSLTFLVVCPEGEFLIAAGFHIIRVLMLASL